MEQPGFDRMADFDDLGLVFGEKPEPFQALHDVGSGDEDPMGESVDGPYRLQLEPGGGVGKGIGKGKVAGFDDQSAAALSAIRVQGTSAAIAY